jgi:hypothetical protein
MLLVRRDHAKRTAQSQAVRTFVKVHVQIWWVTNSPTYDEVSNTSVRLLHSSQEKRARSADGTLVLIIGAIISITVAPRRPRSCLSPRLIIVLLVLGEYCINSLEKNLPRAQVTHALFTHDHGAKHLACRSGISRRTDSLKKASLRGCFTVP